MIQIHQINQTDRVNGLVTMYIHEVLPDNHLRISVIANGELEVSSAIIPVHIKEIAGIAFISPQFILDLDRYNEIVGSYERR